jgi:hypothetical protein
MSFLFWQILFHGLLDAVIQELRVRAVASKY